MFNVEYDILDEISIGDGTKMRLVENIKSKRQSIQLWSEMSKRWSLMYRYDVDTAWAAWKRTETSINNRKKVAKKVKKVRKKG